MEKEIIKFIDSAEVYRDDSENTHIDFKSGIRSPENKILKRITLNSNGYATFIYIE